MVLSILRVILADSYGFTGKVAAPGRHGSGVAGDPTLFFFLTPISIPAVGSTPIGAIRHIHR